MDLKGSLIDARLKIYPSQHFITFLKTLPDEENIPANILKLIGRDCKDDPIEGITEKVVVQLNNKDLENLNKIKDIVKEKMGTVTDKNEPQDDSGDKDMSNDENYTKNEREKSGDTPEKLAKNSVEKEDITDTKDSKRHFLTTSDIDWLYSYIQKRKSKGDDVPYLHTLLEGANVEMPENRTIKRNPALEARCVKLRAQQEAREYRKMTKTVDNVRMRFPEDSISYQMKQMNRQLIAVAQFIISIFAGFLFGFRGVEWMVGNLDFGFRLLLGVMCALVIALAEIYFLAKKLNEELNVPETVQLGGPPKFVDEQKYMHTIPNNGTGKEHQD